MERRGRHRSRHIPTARRRSTALRRCSRCRRRSRPGLVGWPRDEAGIRPWWRHGAADGGAMSVRFAAFDSTWKRLQNPGRSSRLRMLPDHRRRHRGGPIVAYRDRGEQDVATSRVACARRAMDRTEGRPSRRLEDRCVSGEWPDAERARARRRVAVVHGQGRAEPRLRGVLQGCRPHVWCAHSLGRHRRARPRRCRAAARRRCGGELDRVRRPALADRVRRALPSGAKSPR